MGLHMIAVRTMRDIDISPLTTDLGVEAMGSDVDRVDDLLPCSMLTRSTEMCDPLMSVLTRLLVDAPHLQIGHG